MGWSWRERWFSLTVRSSDLRGPGVPLAPLLNSKFYSGSCFLETVRLSKEPWVRPRDWDIAQSMSHLLLVHENVSLLPCI